jgi:SAM-dependent methyltransferase
VGSELTWLRVLRQAEWQRVLQAIQKSGQGLQSQRPRLLEIGAGDGFQASLAALEGFQVVALDIREPEASLHPVWLYEGVRLPFRDAVFDVVFSSNVLEHVEEPQLSGLLGEMGRVLAENGVAVHVLPTPAWRIWTSLTWPFYCAKRVSPGASRQAGAGEEAPP